MTLPGMTSAAAHPYKPEKRHRLGHACACLSNFAKSDVQLIQQTITKIDPVAFPKQMNSIRRRELKGSATYYQILRDREAIWAAERVHDDVRLLTTPPFAS
jgi:hypothetical protein